MGSGRLVTRTQDRPSGIARAAARGAGAGLLGVAVMSAAEKLEQSVTHRPDSYVPGRTLLTLIGGRPGNDDRPVAWNHAMHWGTGAVLGALRGVWAAVSLRGPGAHLAHTVVRLPFDQTLENATGCGAPPRTWPAGEQAWDTAHKAIYSVVTGTLAERFVIPSLESRRGVRSH